MIEKLKQINLNTILIVVSVVLLLLFLKQCSSTSNISDELKIANMNQTALNDSVRTYKDKSGILVHQKSTLIASEKELKTLNKNLYDEVKKLKGDIKIAYLVSTTIKRDTIEVPTIVKDLGNNNYVLDWKTDTTFSKGNFQRLSGSSFLTIDSTGKIIKPSTKINENIFGLSIITGLKEGKDGYEIFVKSEYPGFTVTDIQGSIIDKNMIKSDESNFVFGPTVGVGIIIGPSGINYGVNAGIGVTFNLNKKVKKLFRPYGL